MVAKGSWLTGHQGGTWDVWPRARTGLIVALCAVLGLAGCEAAPSGNGIAPFDPFVTMDDVQVRGRTVHAELYATNAGAEASGFEVRLYATPLDAPDPAWTPSDGPLAIAAAQIFCEQVGRNTTQDPSSPATARFEETVWIVEGLCR